MVVIINALKLPVETTCWFHRALRTWRQFTTPLVSWQGYAYVEHWKTALRAFRRHGTLNPNRTQPPSRLWWPISTRTNEFACKSPLMQQPSATRAQRRKKPSVLVACLGPRCFSSPACPPMGPSLPGPAWSSPWLLLTSFRGYPRLSCRPAFASVAPVCRPPSWRHWLPPGIWTRIPDDGAVTVEDRRIKVPVIIRDEAVTCDKTG